MDNLLGKGRLAIGLISDKDSFQENIIDGKTIVEKDFGDCAVVGTIKINGIESVVIGNDGETYNPRFPVVYAGIIGMEEAYKMAEAVYITVKNDASKPQSEKRPIILVVDTPGNGPGKQEEIFGMNKATGGYQLALAEARHKGHPIVAIVIGRAVSGAFLCHGLQADHILSLDANFGTMIHVMPISSIARITKMDIEKLTAMSASNPVFASGAKFFYQLGGIEELITDIDSMSSIIAKHIEEIRKLKSNGEVDATGPYARGKLGGERKGRIVREKIIQMMNDQFAAVESKYC